MGSRLNPTSNMYIPMNGPPRGPYFPIGAPLNQQLHQPMYPGSFQYQPGFPHLPQQQAQLAQLHNQQLHNQLAQQQQQQAQIAQQQQQQQHALLQQSSQIQHIQLPQSNISNSNTNQNNNQNNNIKEPNIPKTNTQYTNFEVKNLELASRYFSECSTKDFLGSNKKKLSSIAWNANGTKLAASTYDGVTRIWNFDPSGSSSGGSGSGSNRNNNSSSNSGGKEIELKGHDGAVEKICWHPKNIDILATAGVDRFIKIWDIRSGKCIHQINTMGENIDVQWHRDGTYIISCTKEDHIALIDASTNKLMKNFKFTGEEINQVGWDTCGELLFQANGIGNIEVYKFQPKSNEKQLKHLKTLYGHTHSANCIDFDPTGKYFAVGSGDSIVSLWDIEEMMCIRSFTKLAFPCKSISFSFDGQFIASASNESNLDISHVETGQSIHTIESPGAQSIKWHPTLPFLAYAELSETSKDCVVRVFGYHN